MPERPDRADGDVLDRFLAAAARDADPSVANWLERLMAGDGERPAGRERPVEAAEIAAA